MPGILFTSAFASNLSIYRYCITPYAGFLQILGERFGTEISWFSEVMAGSCSMWHRSAYLMRYCKLIWISRVTIDIINKCHVTRKNPAETGVRQRIALSRVEFSKYIICFGMLCIVMPLHIYMNTWTLYRHKDLYPCYRFNRWTLCVCVCVWPR